jgi:hypothetical protein
LLFTLPFTASARNYTFATGIPLTLGFGGGVTAAPESDFTADPRSASRNYSHYYSFSPGLEFTNFALRASLELHQPALLNGEGSNDGGPFYETSDASFFTYGVHLLLAPWVSESLRSRAYFRLGAGYATASLKNVRTYENSGRRDTERASGKALDLSAGFGAEFMLVQNYGLQIEAGYRSFYFDELQYETEQNIRGETVAKGSTVREPNGTPKRLRLQGAFIGLALNMHF